jgi:peptidyl-prolyl cis-trans isomerase D
MTKGPQTPIVTKKHQARLERERIQNRYILIASIAVIVIIVALLGYGSVQQYLIQPRQPVAKVGTEVINTRQFQAYARYTRFQLIQQYAQYVSFAQMFGGSDPNSQQYLAQYWSQVNYQLEVNTLGQTVIDQLINFSLIKQYADENGITISQEAVDLAEEDFFQYYPGGTPTTAPTREILPTSTLSPAQVTIIPPTPTVVVTETASLTPTATLAPTPTASGPTATAVPQPTSTEYTQDAFQTNYNNYVDYLGTNVGISAIDLRWIIEMQLYQSEVYKIITADVADAQDQVWARHIVVADELTANDVLTRLQNREDFATLAAELSTDTNTSTTGGDLGWFGLGMQDPALEKVAYNLEIGQLSEPIQTASGWEIVQVLGHEVRQLTNDQLDQAKTDVFQAWLVAQREVRVVQIFDIWTTRVPTVPTLPPLGQ